MLDSKFNLKIIDFGTCVYINDELEPMVGSLETMAPENFIGGKIGCESDIWSFGCIVYFLTMR